MQSLQALKREEFEIIQRLRRNAHSQIADEAAFNEEQSALSNSEAALKQKIAQIDSFMSKQEKKLSSLKQRIDLEQFTIHGLKHDLHSGNIYIRMLHGEQQSAFRSYSTRLTISFHLVTEQVAAAEEFLGRLAKKSNVSLARHKAL